MVGLAGVDIAVPILRGYIAKAFQLIVHVSRLAGGARKITRISELLGLRKDLNYRVKDIFRFEQSGVENGQAIGTFAMTGYVPKVNVRFGQMGYPIDESFYTARTLGDFYTLAPSEEAVTDLKPVDAELVAEIFSDEPTTAKKKKRQGESS
jgi:pilus assembly protein CpaF